jgi:hypothetical protein
MSLHRKCCCVSTPVYATCWTPPGGTSQAPLYATITFSGIALALPATSACGVTAGTKQLRTRYTATNSSQPTYYLPPPWTPNGTFALPGGDQNYQPGTLSNAGRTDTVAFPTYPREELAVDTTYRNRYAMSVSCNNGVQLEISCVLLTQSGQTFTPGETLFYARFSPTVAELNAKSFTVANNTGQPAGCHRGGTATVTW